MALSWGIAGAFAFGLVVGWNVYFVNRYRRGEIGFGDITSLVGTVGGAAVLALYDRTSDLFGAYGVGLGVGFFLYFLSLVRLVSKSPNFEMDWFLDGRRKNPADGWGYDAERRPTMAPMAPRPTGEGGQASPVTIQFHGANPAETALGTHGIRLAPSHEAANQIEQACRTVWAASGPHGRFRDACNFFAIEVGQQLGVALSGRADQIIAAVQDAPGWTALADGAAAREVAGRGMLVLAGVPSTAYTPPRSEGHVAVVTPGAMNPAGWAPAGYWGSTEPKVAVLGGSGAPISNCFSAAVKDKIVYRAHAV